MAVHMAMMGKLNLLASGPGHWQLLAALLCPFALKFPFTACMPGSYADLVFSLRLFFFRMNQIFFDDSVGRNEGRWERAVRLLRERLSGDGRWIRITEENRETLNAISMLAL